MNLERINKTQEELNFRLLNALYKMEELLSQALGDGQVKEPLKKEGIVQEGLLYSIQEKQEETEAIINSLHLKVSRLENIVVGDIVNFNAPIISDEGMKLFINCPTKHD